MKPVVRIRSLWLLHKSHTFKPVIRIRPDPKTAVVARLARTSSHLKPYEYSIY